MQLDRLAAFAFAILASPGVTTLVSSAVAAPPSAADARVGDALVLQTTHGSVTVHVRADDRTAAGGRVIIADRADALGRALIAVRDGAMAGYLVGVGGTWHLRRHADGSVVFEPAPTGFDCAVGDDARFDFGPGAVERLEPIELDEASDAAAVAGGCADEGVFHDLLVIYPEEVVTAWGGEAATLAEIDAIVALSNLALENSATTPRFRLALAWPTDADNGISLGDLTDPDDGVADEVHDLRNLVAADQVIMLYEGGGGVANGVWTFDPEQEANAFNRSGIDSFPYVFPHEIGHNMGCCHAVGDGGGCPAEGGLLFPYSNGHRWFGHSGTEWRTIMAYSPGERTDHFSNPAVSFDGEPTGTVDADNALTMAMSQEFVANFRCSQDALCGDLSDPNARADCNENGLPDGCDIGSGTSADANGNGIPDECEPCPADVDGSGAVTFNDLLQVLAAWGPCAACPEDIDGDGAVAFGDVLALLAAWGDC